MSVLREAERLPGVLVHQTGSMVRFTTSQLPHLPRRDLSFDVTLPDGRAVTGNFHPHPRNPYIGGRELVRWIKSWVPYGDVIPVSLVQIGTQNRVRIEITAPAAGATFTSQAAVARAARAFFRDAAPRRRVRYERWERSASLRDFVLSIWAPTCQVRGCDTLSAAGVPTALTRRLVDVHHLNHVGTGGTDSPLNLSVLCVTHHTLIHRAPSTMLISAQINHAAVRVDGIVLDLDRDVRALMTALNGEL